MERLDYRVDKWDKDFQTFIANLEAKGKPVILWGDLNVAHKDIDIHQPKGAEKSAGFTPQEKKSFGEFLDKGYIDTFRHLHPEEKKFSYWSAMRNSRENNKGWRLDYFVVSKSIISAVEESSIHSDVYGSDHCPISVTLKLSNFEDKKAKKSSKK